MHLRPEITLRDLPETRALENYILKKIDKLNQVCERIMHCDVVVEQDQKHKHTGKLYHTRIALTVPEREIVINRNLDENVFVATKDAFDAARRKLLSYVKQRRGEVKNHEPLHSGRIVRLYPEEGFGFIESEGNDYYFSDTNVGNGHFNQLKIGDQVEFLPTFGSEGFQANHVLTS